MKINPFIIGGKSAGKFSRRDSGKDNKWQRNGSTSEFTYQRWWLWGKQIPSSQKVVEHMAKRGNSKAKEESKKETLSGPHFLSLVYI